MFGICSKCQKKSYMPFESRCGKYFCNKHRYSDKHNCQFDYRQQNAKRIKEENNKVRTAKLIKIEDLD